MSTESKLVQLDPDIAFEFTPDCIDVKRLGALNPAGQGTTMKTSTVEVGELVSTLSAAGVERQLSMLPGVFHHVDVNYVAGSATVRYDESRIALEAIRQRVIDCGYHCRGELVPAHVCDPGRPQDDRRCPRRRRQARAAWRFRRPRCRDRFGRKGHP